MKRRSKKSSTAEKTNKVNLNTTTVKTTSYKKRPLGTLAKLLAMLIPSIIIAAIVGGLGIHLSDSWQEGAASGRTVSQQDREDIMSGEKAQTELERANEAMTGVNTSAGVLDKGMKELKKGSDELKAGSAQARSGSAELANGMDEIAGGTKELGSGAKQIAGGVTSAVDGVMALKRYQRVAAAAVDAAIPTLVGDDPDTVRTRESLKQLSRVLHDEKASEDAARQLRALQRGANEMSRQLNPGGPYYEGVMRARGGSRELANGLVQLDNGNAELVKGVSKLQGISKANAKQTSAAYKAVLTLMRMSNDAQAAAWAEEQLALQKGDVKPSLPLSQAYLVSALLALAAAAAWWSRLRLGTKEIIGVWLLMTTIASTATLTSMEGLNATTGAFLVSTIAVGSAALLTAAGAIVLLLGRKWGLIVNIALAFTQAAVSGFVWLEEWPSAMSRFFDSLMPVSYITSALAAIGNAGDSAMAWLSTGALLTLTTIAIFVALTVVRKNPRAGVPAAIGVNPNAVADTVAVGTNNPTPYSPMDTDSLSELDVNVSIPHGQSEDYPTDIIDLPTEVIDIDTAGEAVVDTDAVDDTAEDTDDEDDN